MEMNRFKMCASRCCYLREVVPALGNRGGLAEFTEGAESRFFTSFAVEPEKQSWELIFSRFLVSLLCFQITSNRRDLCAKSDREPLVLSHPSWKEFSRGTMTISGVFPWRTWGQLSRFWWSGTVSFNATRCGDHCRSTSFPARARCRNLTDHCKITATLSSFVCLCLLDLSVCLWQICLGIQQIEQNKGECAKQQHNSHFFGPGILDVLGRSRLSWSFRLSILKPLFSCSSFFSFSSW